MAYRERSFVLTAGETVRERRVEAEPGQHVGGRQRGERAESPDAEPAQQVDAARVAGPIARRCPNAGEEVAGAWSPGATIRPAAGGEPGGEHALGDADLRLDSGTLSDLLDQVLGRRFLPTEVAGRAAGVQRAHAGPDHLDAGRQLLDRGDHRLEGAGVAARVVLDHHNCGQRACASRLRSPRRTPSARAAAEQAMTRLAASTATGCTASNAVDDPGGHHRPVRAPHDERTRHEQQFRTHVR